jgi:hypothetical protein
MQFAVELPAELFPGEIVVEGDANGIKALCLRRRRDPIVAGRRPRYRSPASVTSARMTAGRAA